MKSIFSESSSLLLILMTKNKVFLIYGNLFNSLRLMTLPLHFIAVDYFSLQSLTSFEMRIAQKFGPHIVQNSEPS